MLTLKQLLALPRLPAAAIAYWYRLAAFHLNCALLSRCKKPMEGQRASKHMLLRFEQIP